MAISNITYYNGGMEANDVKRLKELEEENAKLKKYLQKSALKIRR
ncbi:hypothetical protein PROSTU_01005 [Providencia stuartii ATCC 25827]|uniref:Transposase n=1 Tax=Providencia stuartii ATCC 25827 TaxID=471874 RepID=A0AA86YYN0_PROST|nr:hypothetical protein PROSTU_01005 [Providencia stuartii ATCC 25827]